MKARRTSTSDTSTTLGKHTETQTNAAGDDVRLVHAAGKESGGADNHNAEHVSHPVRG